MSGPPLKQRLQPQFAMLRGCQLCVCQDYDVQACADSLPSQEMAEIFLNTARPITFHVQMFRVSPVCGPSCCRSIAEGTLTAGTGAVVAGRSAVTGLPVSGFISALGTSFSEVRLSEALSYKLCTALPKVSFGWVQDFPRAAVSSADCASRGGAGSRAVFRALKVRLLLLACRLSGFVSLADANFNGSLPIVSQDCSTRIALSVTLGRQYSALTISRAR